MVFFTAVWLLGQYKDIKERFSIETGVRLDILKFRINDDDIKTPFAVNPRLNIDYFLLRDKGNINLLTLTAGAGMFSSTNESFEYIDNEYGISNDEAKQSRALVGIAGINIEFADDYLFNLEFYYKYLYDRCYSNLYSVSDKYAVSKFFFDGTGKIFGFDIMLQKIKGRYVSGWLSYSFLYARHNDPESKFAFRFAKFPADSDKWFYPDFHRFSYINFVLNFRVRDKFNIYTRFGLAGGTPQIDYGDPEDYYIEENGRKARRWKRTNTYSDTLRSDVSIPLDLKFSWYFFNPKGKSQTEVYVAIENTLVLFYKPEGATNLNPYTGEPEAGTSGNAIYDLPVPMISFGIKWIY